MRYVIVIEPTPDGRWGAWAPDVPGVVALGDTREECEREMAEAVAFHLDGLRADGAALPPPTAVVSAVETGVSLRDHRDPAEPLVLQHLPVCPYGPAQDAGTPPSVIHRSWPGVDLDPTPAT